MRGDLIWSVVAGGCVAVWACAPVLGQSEERATNADGVPLPKQPESGGGGFALERAPDLPEMVRELASRLGHDEWSKREAAEQALLAMGPLAFDAIERLLESGELNAEQRVRLTRISWTSFQDLERAGMGISFGSQNEGAPARIGMTIEGFDSVNVLRANDIIVEFDGRPIATGGDLRVAILSRRPGERVELGIMRNGVVVRDTLELGSYGDLGNTRSLDINSLRDAWMFRCGGYQSTDVIGPGLTAERWAAAEVVTASDRVDGGGRSALELGALTARAAGENVRLGSQEDLNGLRERREQLQRLVAMRRENVRAMRARLDELAGDPRRLREVERNIELFEQQMRERLDEIRRIDQQIELRGGR